MTAKPLTGLEKVGVLLKSLPADIVEKVLRHMDARHAGLITSELAKLKDRPDLKENLALVLEEAASIINGGPQKQAAKAQSGAAPAKPAAEPAKGNTVDIRLDDKPPEKPRLALVPPPAAAAWLDDGLDPLRAISLVPSDLLALALDSENTRTVSLLMNSMDIDVAGQLYKRLSPAKRKDVSLRFTEQATVPDELIKRIAQGVLKKCRSLRDSMSPASGEQGGREKRMAALLRGLERTERMEMLAALEANDAELTGRIKALLYQFEDILRMDNSSVQKFLSEIDVKSLALALHGAPQEIQDKILANLSKRAQESLKEEIGLTGTVPAAKSRQARQTLIEAIQRLDQRGELVIIEQVDAMQRHTVSLRGRLAGVSRATGAEPVAAPSAPPPPAAAPTKPQPASPPRGEQPVAGAPSAEQLALRKVVVELERKVKEIQAQDRRTVAEVAQLSVELGMAIAERLVHAAIAADRQRLDQMVLQVLERMPAARSVTVRGHADDLALLQRQFADHADGRSGEMLTYRREDTFPRGQLKLEAEDCFMEWDTQRSLGELRAVLLEETFLDE